MCAAETKHNHQSVIRVSDPTMKIIDSISIYICIILTYAQSDKQYKLIELTRLFCRLSDVYPDMHAALILL